MTIQGETTVKFGTTCCALAILSAMDTTPDHELDWQINKLREESRWKWKPGNRRGGETAIACITVPMAELNLERKLRERGFVVLTTFNRRTGYPQTGKLKLWFLNLFE